MINIIDTIRGDITWHIGESFPFSKQNLLRIKSIEASNEELDLIFKAFNKTIPFSQDKVQSWYGDTAKTISFFLRKHSKKEKGKLRPDDAFRYMSHKPGFEYESDR